MYDLSMNMRNSKFYELLGNKSGTFVDVDQIDLLIPSKTLKIRVDCVLDKLLHKGLILKLNNKPTYTSSFRAFAMHEVFWGICELYDPNVPESELPNGSWIHTSAVKKKRRRMRRKYHKKKKKQLLGLREYSSYRSGAKTRLTLKNSSMDDMNIDNNPSLLIANFKTKKEGLDDGTSKDHKIRAQKLIPQNYTNVKEATKVLEQPPYTNESIMPELPRVKRDVLKSILQTYKEALGQQMPLAVGLVKVNFNKAKLGECSKGWGAIGRNTNSNNLFTAIKQSPHFLTPDVKEVNTCLFALNIAWKYEYKKK
ncbi:hypothetical protein Cgig2_009084 [Carnegiea gigantea]|uniref:Uncharacterized protein n=1 Tax=Carnegiea gigantea TaxID=171969 RepID=A0A9Q1QH64_9CARY|nr:hypothetical protein Cgig2_009084 [Carnegiea gigantea]